MPFPTTSTRAELFPLIEGIDRSLSQPAYNLSYHTKIEYLKYAQHFIFCYIQQNYL